MTGEASTNSLANLAAAGVLTLEWVEEYVAERLAEKKAGEGGGGGGAAPQG